MVRFLRIKGKLFMMQRMSARHLILALFLLTLAGCKKNYVFNEDLSILFQYEYRNDTDMKKHHGFIITGKGDVLEYNVTMKLRDLSLGARYQLDALITYKMVNKWQLMSITPKIFKMLLF